MSNATMSKSEEHIGVCVERMLNSKVGEDKLTCEKNECPFRDDCSLHPGHSSFDNRPCQVVGAGNA